MTTLNHDNANSPDRKMAISFDIPRELKAKISQVAKLRNVSFEAQVREAITLALNDAQELERLNDLQAASRPRRE